MMRWRYRPWIRPKVGDTRVWFAWHPVVVGKQWVWLEYVNRTLLGWYTDMNGSESVYEYAEIKNPGDQASGSAGAD